MQFLNRLKDSVRIKKNSLSFQTLRHCDLWSFFEGFSGEKVRGREQADSYDLGNFFIFLSLLLVSDSHIPCRSSSTDSRANLIESTGKMGEKTTPLRCPFPSAGSRSNLTFRRGANSTDSCAKPLQFLLRLIKLRSHLVISIE